VNEWHYVTERTKRIEVEPKGKGSFGSPTHKWKNDIIILLSPFTTSDIPKTNLNIIPHFTLFLPLHKLSQAHFFMFFKWKFGLKWRQFKSPKKKKKTQQHRNQISPKTYTKCWETRRYC